MNVAAHESADNICGWRYRIFEQPYDLSMSEKYNH